LDIERRQIKNQQSAAPLQHYTVGIIFFTAYKMKTIKSKLRSPNVSRTGTGTKKPAPPKNKSTLPAWVIGAYDGPSDGKLSLKKGYTL
jgi:hypothetical protein